MAVAGLLCSEIMSTSGWRIINQWDTYGLQSVSKLSSPVAAFGCSLLVSLSADSFPLFLFRRHLHIKQERVTTQALKIHIKKAKHHQM